MLLQRHEDLIAEPKAVFAMLSDVIAIAAAPARPTARRRLP